MKNKSAIRKAMVELEMKEPGSSDEVLPQRQLQEWESLKDELRALTQKFKKKDSQIHSALKEGASVSTGKRGVESGIRFRRHPRYKQALIDAKGEDYQKKVLEGTEYRPYHFVRLITRNGGGDK
jgi:hypothetical protein